MKTEERDETGSDIFHCGVNSPTSAGSESLKEIWMWRTVDHSELRRFELCLRFDLSNSQRSNDVTRVRSNREGILEPSGYGGPEDDRGEEVRGVTSDSDSFHLWQYRKGTSFGSLL